MNAVSDSLLNKAEEKVETAGQMQTAEQEAVLVELGMVSDTHGQFLGAKIDTGLGFWFF